MITLKKDKQEEFVFKSFEKANAFVGQNPFAEFEIVDSDIHWVYHDRYAVFKKGDDMVELEYGTAGTCHDPECSCSGNVTYNIDFLFEDDKEDLEGDGYEFQYYTQKNFRT
jgi:hypothetical protein